MRCFVTAAILSIATLYLAGCKSQQETPKESADQITAQMLDVVAQYRGACQTPSEAVSKAAVHDAMVGAAPAEQQAHQQRASAEEQARITSPTCKALAAKRDALSARLNALAKAGPQK